VGRDFDPHHFAGLAAIEQVLRDQIGSTEVRSNSPQLQCDTPQTNEDRMSLSLQRRLTLDAVARVTRIGQAEPQARRVSHERL
jgi:hypothetical protein